MKEIFDRLNLAEDANLFPILSDSTALVIANIAKRNNKVLYIASSEEKLEQLKSQLEYFLPNKKIVLLSSWDCSPYDKISPSISNLNLRIDALEQLLIDEDKLVITTIAAIFQYLPPVDLISTYAKKIAVKEVINREDLLKILVMLGFRRVEVASEPGDFAVRGDIIDVVDKPEVGWRIDFYGNEVEKIREFDPATQLSSASIESIKLMPSSEVILTENTINNFIVNFDEVFANFANEHPLFAAISSGRKYPGMEHYLPFFYDKLTDFFAYFNPDKVILAPEFNNNVERFIENIEEYYSLRKHQLSSRMIDEIIFYPVEIDSMWMSKEDFLQKIKGKSIYLHNFSGQYSNNFELAIKRIDNFDLQAQSKKISAFDLFKKFREQNKGKILITCYSEGSLTRIKKLLDNYNIHWFMANQFEDYRKISGKTVALAMVPINHGFSFDELIIVSEQDLIGEKIIRKKSTKSIEKLIEEINNLQIGEYVVHQDHGIAIFSGLDAIKAAGIEHDCIKLTYDGGDILYIPVENLDLLTRFGGEEEHVRLDKLGGTSWNIRKEKLKEKLKEIAAVLVKTAALRAKKVGELLSPVANIYEEFCKRFPYLETEDQHRSIKDVEEDLRSGKPMDRLICGDVGFGKTEVALRAAFIATNPENNIKQQVALIVPTTLLARQHYISFCKRFEGFGINLRQYSRLVPAKELKQTREALKNNEVDIVIGTHALLGKDISFNNLGLLIVDEEQKFGVMQKERLKSLQENVHILTLSATPIPRTLQMSLTGVRDLSIIATPPIDRQAIKTYIMPYDSVVIREAIMREFYRGGQVFFVCPRISDINEILPKLTELVPEIKIVVAHGQMSAGAIEEIMSDFYNKKFNLLLSTSIVESGIDIAEANTMIIHRADKFGLSALYQLRGRVGRSNVKAYSYLLLPNHKLSRLAITRLEVMQTLDTLGAGFTVASHDMDIRGFGNLVGDEQSGHIKEVGLELYQQMLHDAVLALKDPASVNDYDGEFSPQINLGISVMLPEYYVEDLNLRLSLYRKLAAFKLEEEIEQFAVELIDRFGQYSIEVEYLLEVLKLKIKAKKVNIDKIDAGPKAITFSFRNNICSFSDKLINFVEQNQRYLRIRADQKLLITKEFIDTNQKIRFIEDMLKKLGDLNNIG